MSKILLDYVFPITVVTPTPQASTAFLKQVCVVAKPKTGQEGNVGNLYLCTTMTDVATRTDNTNAQQLFNAGMNRVYVLLANDLDLQAALDEVSQNFFTVLVSDDFDEDDVAGAKASGVVEITSYANLVSTGNDKIAVAGVEFVAGSGAATPGAATFQAATSNADTAESLAAQINAHAVAGALVEATADGAEVTILAKARGLAGNSIALVYTDMGTATVGATVSGATLTGGTAAADFGAFKGVVGVALQDTTVLAAQAVIGNRCAFKASITNKAKNMFFAFGKVLSNTASWRNQQYIEMPFSDEIDSLGDANSLFDSKISFVLDDDEFGKRLALLAAGGRAIVAPYILENIRIDMKSGALQWISANQPQFTLKNAVLLETRLQEDVINSYVSRGLIIGGKIEISLVQQNFVANGDIDIPQPTALWRVTNEMVESV